MLSASSYGFKGIADELEGDIARAATQAMRETTVETRDRLREQTRSAGLSDRLLNTWTARAYPNGAKNSINPAGVVYSRAPDIMDAFTRGATIRPISGGKYLWLPTDNVPKAPRRTGVSRGASSAKMTPEDCERRFRTEFVIKPGRNGRLLAYMDLQAGRRRPARADARKRLSGGSGARLTLMFVLTRSVTMPRLIDLDATANNWMSRYEAALRRGFGQ